MDNIIKYLDILPDDIDVIFDIGANTGKEIPFLLNRWKNAKIYCFEPIKEIYDNLLIEYGGVVEVYNIALSDKSGKKKFYESYREGALHLGSSSLRKPKDHLIHNPSILFKSYYEVNCQTLDDFCIEKSIKNIDFVWMDAQGSEYDIIKSSSIIKSAKYIYTEAYENEMYEGQGTRNDIVKHLCNFSVVDIHDPYNILLRNTDE